MVRSIVIPHDTERRPALVGLADLGAFQEAVDGWLDLIEIPSIGVTVYLNEAARRTHGPLNTRATAFWWLHSAQPTDYPVILGDVVLTGVGDEEDEGDIPEAVVEQIFHRDNFVVQVRPYDRNSWRDSFALRQRFRCGPLVSAVRGHDASRSTVPRSERATDSHRRASPFRR